MRIQAFILAAAMAAAPLGALAQEGPPPGGPGMPAMSQTQRDQMRSTMHASMQQAMQIHKQARAQMLSALTPAHRALLAQIAGGLAVSASPDPRAAAKQLDAALTPAERQSVLATAANVRTQMQALHQQLRAKMEQVAPRPSHSPWPERGTKRQHRTPSAGMILLMMAGSGEHMGMGMRDGGAHPRQR